MPTSTIFRADLQGLLSEQQPPCLSLYMPTHRRHPENQQDPILYKNLLKDLDSKLQNSPWSGEANGLLASFVELAGNTDFWNHTWDGLAVFAAPGFYRLVKVQRPLPQRNFVSTTFHIKPLMRILQSVERYQLLSLNRREIRLFEGSRDQLDEVQLAPGVPKTITEALGEELTEPHQTVASYGGTQNGSSMRHSHGGKKDEVDIDEERFFRAVDRSILEHHSRPSGLPLILAALAEYHTPFRRASHNSALLESGIEADIASLSISQLRERAWQVMEPQFLRRIQVLVDAFGEAQSRNLGSSDLGAVAQAAAASRVKTLLVQAELQIPGSLNTETGAVTLQETDPSGANDLLDEVAELVLHRGGQVLVVPPSDMPATTGLAAIYRF